MTPRKPRTRNHASSTSQPPLVSDYDSEAQYTAPTPLRTPEQINFSVIARYVPSLSKILSIAQSAYIYTLAHSTGTWEKTNIEGSMFVCELTPSPITGSPRHCIIVLNRKGLENLIIDSGEIEAVEISDEFLLLSFRSKEELLVQNQDQQTKILGFFLTTNSEKDREEVCQLVKSHWEIAMKERESGEGREGMVENFGDEGYGIAAGGAVGEGVGENKAMGRRLSLTELFRQR
jgi:hypothetical protein